MKLGNKSNKTFEQIATYRGKPQAEKLFYMFSQAYYKTEHIIIYQFESFVSGYPKSEKYRKAYLGPVILCCHLFIV
jgi:outer membrane protein assembly factor BamD